jgi:O-antigen/teichoic acid export membrane protein
MTQASAGELRAVARSGGVSLVGAALSAIFGFGVVVQVSRGLGTAGAGAFSVAVAVAMTLSVAGRFGTDTALVRMLPRLRALHRDRDLRSAALAALIPVSVGTTLLAGLLWWIAPPVAEVVFAGPPPPGAVALVRVAAATIPLSAAGFVALAVTRGLGTVVPLTVVENLAKPVLRCACVGIALLLGAGVYGVMIAWAAPAAVGAFLSLMLAQRSLRKAAPEGPDRSEGLASTGREIWTFAAPRAAAAACEIAGMHLGIVLVSAVAGAPEAGVYNAVLRVALAGTLALQALRLAIAPRLSHLLTSGRVAEVAHVHQTATVWITLGSFPVYLIVAGWPGPVLHLFGPGFGAGAAALSILAVAMLVNLATGTVSTVLLMSGRSGLTLALTAGSLGLGALLTVLLAPHFGVLGAAVAKGIAVVFENTVATWLVYRTTGVRTWSHPLGLALAAALGCFAVPTMIARLLGAGAVPLLVAGACCYLVLLWRWRVLFELAAVLPFPAQRHAGTVLRKEPQR